MNLLPSCHFLINSKYNFYKNLEKKLIKIYFFEMHPSKFEIMLILIHTLRGIFAYFLRPTIPRYLYGYSNVVKYL